jgi:DNA mismatch repair ATPase MutS
VFLHEVVPGAADRSYGLQVARLAGLPAPVIARAHSVTLRVALESRSRRWASPVSSWKWVANSARQPFGTARTAAGRCSPPISTS